MMTLVRLDCCGAQTHSDESQLLFRCDHLCHFKDTLG
jgi:hypothetical protein